MHFRFPHSHDNSVDHWGTEYHWHSSAVGRVVIDNQEYLVLGIAGNTLYFDSHDHVPHGSCPGTSHTVDGDSSCDGLQLGRRAHVQAPLAYIGRRNRVHPCAVVN